MPVSKKDSPPDDLFEDLRDEVARLRAELEEKDALLEQRTAEAAALADKVLGWEDSPGRPADGDIPKIVLVTLPLTGLIIVLTDPDAARDPVSVFGYLVVLGLGYVGIDYLVRRFRK